VRDIPFTSFTTATGFDWDRVASIRITMGTTMSNNEAISIDNICIYKYSNGHGPVLGNMRKYLAGEVTAIVRGVIVKLDPLGGMVGQVLSANANDTGVVGISCTDAAAVGDTVYVQFDGPAIAEFASLTTLELGDGMACGDNDGLTVVQGTATLADCFASYLGVVKTTAGQYEVGWIDLGKTGAPPS
jgi:hypothetical protein